MKTTNKPTLRCTKDYDLFEPHPYNRDVSRTKVLEESMERFGFDDGLPIRCVRNGNGKLKITHGHHRFHVARKKGLPVWFIVASNDIPLFESEASGHAWNVRDFTVARARAGERAAEAVLQYHEKTGIPLQACISLVGGEGASSGNKSIAMKTGRFKVGDPHHADMIARIVDHCKKHGVAFAAHSYFVAAISKCLFVEEFDAELFLRKVATHSKLMEPRRSLDDYLDLVELIFNRKSKQKVPLAFLAREKGMERKVTFGGRNSA